MFVVVVTVVSSVEEVGLIKVEAKSVSISTPRELSSTKRGKSGQ
jgi:hypothetical protein